MICFVRFIVAMILIFVSGKMKAKADTISHDPSNTDWINKYKKPLTISEVIPWYYFGIKKPKFVEAFPYSSTALVFLTDKWHLYNFIQYRCVDAAIVIAMWNPWALSLLIALPLLRGLAMHLWYRT